MKVILILAALFAISASNPVANNFKHVRSLRAKQLLSEIFHDHERWVLI